MTQQDGQAAGTTPEGESHGPGASETSDAQAVTSGTSTGPCPPAPPVGGLLDYSDPTKCNPALPIRLNREDFRFGRFVRLFTVRGAQRGPAVIPRHIVQPEVSDDVLKQIHHLPEDISLPLVWGGPPPFEDWCGTPKPRPHQGRKLPLDIPDVPVDLGDMMSTGTIALDGQRYPLNIDDDTAQQLLGGSSVVLGLETVHGKRLIRLAPESRDLPPGPGGSVRYAVRDLAAFVRDPVIALAGARSSRVKLSDANLRELHEIGVTRVGDIGHDRAVVYVEVANTPEPRGLPDSDMPREGAVTFSGSGGAPTGKAITYIEMKATAIKDEAGQATVDLERMRAQLRRALGAELELVLHLPYRQQWTLLGYSRGELLSSISLTPQEEVTIELFTWDRTKRDAEQQSSLEREGTLSLDQTSRLTTELMNEVTRNSDWGWNVDGKITVPVKGADVGFGGGVNDQQTLNRVDRATVQAISEAVEKATSRVKATHQTKVVETHEYGRETRTTRKIKNPNMCRVLTFDYFGVDASMCVRTTPLPDEARICVLTPNPVQAPLDRAFILGYEVELRSALENRAALATYEAAFAAAKRLAASERYCKYKCGARCSCDASPPQPQTTPVPAPSGSTTDPAAVRNAAITEAKKRVASAAGQLRSAIGAVADASLTPICSVALRSLNFFSPPADSEWVNPKAEYRRYLYRSIVLEHLAVSFWSKCRDFRASNDNGPEALERALHAGDLDLGTILNLSILQLRYQAAQFKFAYDVIKGLCANPVPLVDPANLGFDDGGMGAAFDAARQALDAYKAANDIPVIASASAPSTPSTTSAPASVAEQALPPFDPAALAADSVMVDALLSHLTRNESYYRHAIWREMDAVDRFRYLSLALGDDFPRMVDMEVVGYVGDRVALPIVEGALPELDAWLVEIATREEAEHSERLVTVPTGSVVASGRLDECDVCEDYIVRHRELDLQAKAADVEAACERARQEKFESDRRERRLQEVPPLLDAPQPAAPELRIQLQNDPS